MDIPLPMMLIAYGEPDGRGMNPETTYNLLKAAAWRIMDLESEVASLRRRIMPEIVAMLAASSPEI